MAIRGVYKFFDVSTGHITEQDNKRIQQDDFPLACYAYDQGYFIHIGHDISEKEIELREFGMSEAFIKVWKRTAELDCWFLRLDADGTQFEGFEKFEW